MPAEVVSLDHERTVRGRTAGAKFEATSDGLVELTIRLADGDETVATMSTEQAARLIIQGTDAVETAEAR